MSQDDQEGVRNVDDDNFIDDSGVDPADRYDEPHSPGDAPQVNILFASFLGFRMLAVAWSLSLHIFQSNGLVVPF